MDARRGALIRGASILGGITASVVLLAAFAHAGNDAWGADIDGDRVGVGGVGSSGVEQASDSGAGGSSAGQADGPGGGPVVESQWVSDCVGLDGDGVLQDACGAAFNCPQNEPGAPLFIRMRLYQRELDPSSGDPVTDWQQVATECFPETLGGLLDDADQDGGPSLIQLVTEEWERVQIPAARLGINPVDGRTLVNFDTIFFTDDEEQSFPVTVLSRSVMIYAVPVEFTWHYGDGSTSTTSSAGAPYPSMEITHTYEATGAVSPRVDVQYRAEFTVDGGERQPIPGVAEVTRTWSSSKPAPAWSTADSRTPMICPGWTISRPAHRSHADGARRAEAPLRR